MAIKIITERYEQPSLFGDEEPFSLIENFNRTRTDPMFLRNQFEGFGKYGIPLVRKQKIPLTNINLIAYTNIRKNEQEFSDFGVHFFVDDCKFQSLYKSPENRFSTLSQYRFCLTPDYSLYGEMPTWRQIESVAHSRWCGAWWQQKGMQVIPTISWDKYQSYDFCFEGVESGSIVAVATYACKHERSTFCRGYDAMLERINPEAIICYGTPFSTMRGNIISIDVCHPRQFHRAI